MTNRIQSIFADLSLNKKIQVLLLGAVFGNLVFLGVFWVYYQKDIDDYSLESDQKLLESSIDVLIAEINNVNNISKLISASQSVRNYLTITDEHADSYTRSVRLELYKYIYLRAYMGSMYVIRENGEFISITSQAEIVYTNQEMVKSQQWQQLLNEKKGRAMLCYNGAGAFELKTEKPILSYARAVYDIDTQKKIGYLVINLNEKFWLDTFASLLNNPSLGVQVCDEANNTYFDSGIDQELLNVHGSKITEYGKKVAYQQRVCNLLRKRVSDYNMVILLQDNDTHVSGPINGFVRLLVLYLIFSSLCWLVIRHVIRMKVTEPIEQLAESMDSAQDGWLRRVSIKTGNDEIGLLKNSYNTMLVEINRLLEELMRKEAEKYRLEFDILQEQLKPHFLYNTLYTIEYIALKNEDQEVCSSLRTLGSFYRNFLSKGSREILLTEEVKIIEDYLKLQALRFSDVFEVNIVVAEEVEKCYVLRLILQPLVENCIYHGVRPKGELCTISINIRQVDDRIHFSVMDTGVGMSKEKIAAVFHEKSNKSFGLKATIERIRLYYGIDDVYEIHSEEGEFTEVIIKVPLRRIANERNN